MSQVRARITISGRVQGVNFRAYTQAQAKTFGVRGWVRNLDDGRVEAIAEGSQQAVQQLISRCHSGPSRASVERVEVSWESPVGESDVFSIVW